MAAEVSWIVSLLCELGLASSTPPCLWCDNLGATYLYANPIFHARTKHVEVVDFHFIHDKVALVDLHMNFISTKYQVVDIFTKLLSTTCFELLRDKFNVMSTKP